ncbi:MAG: sulfur oxidation c-type cytochrome SoxX [Betaproteobacteria bacterium]|jgi:sulfur-oxidizing protein SoxX
MSAKDNGGEINAPDVIPNRMRPAAVTRFVSMAAVCVAARAVTLTATATATFATTPSIGQPPTAPIASRYTISGDGITEPLSGLRGDAARGKSIVINRQQGLCVLCHQLPSGSNVAAVFQGNIAPSLDGAGARLSEAQLRLRLVDSRAISPHSVMPAYYRVDALTRVSSTFQGKPILDAQQIEDVVAYLMTLR